VATTTAPCACTNTCLQRGDLSSADRQRAQHALAQDFLKAGLLDRAEAALQPLENTPLAAQARLALLALYERTREWDKAAEVAERLENAEHGSFRQRLAHYRCEQAALLRQQGRTTEALAELETVVQQVPDSARGWVALADMRHSLGHTEGALQALEQLACTRPGAPASGGPPSGAVGHAFWLTRAGTASAATLGSAAPPGAGRHAGSGQSGARPRQGRALYIQHLQNEPSLVAATLWLNGEHFGQPEEEKRVKASLERACTPLKRYRCAACGFEAQQYFWQCPGCQSWDSYPPRRVEEL
jgi:lipopolysaccharide assembly protein B